MDRRQRTPGERLRDAWNREVEAIFRRRYPTATPDEIRDRINNELRCNNEPLERGQR